MNKILVPTDFSEHSNYALEYASFIAKEKGSALYIVHILIHKKMEDVEEDIKRLKMLKYLRGIDYKLILEKGNDVGRTINKVGLNHKIDLVIMGSNGVSNIEEMLLGSNTENVIRKTHFNVLTIKHRMPNLRVSSILFPSDFSPEAYNVFQTIKDYAEIFDAQIHLLYVNTQHNFENSSVILERMDALIEHFKLTSEHKRYKRKILDDVSHELGVLNYSIDNDIDIIAIGSHGKGLLQKIIHASTSHNLVRDSYRPVLTIRF